MNSIFFSFSSIYKTDNNLESLNIQLKHYKEIDLVGKEHDRDEAYEEVQKLQTFECRAKYAASLSLRTVWSLIQELELRIKKIEEEEIELKSTMEIIKNRINEDDIELCKLNEELSHEEEEVLSVKTALQTQWNTIKTHELDYMNITSLLEVFLLSF